MADIQTVKKKMPHDLSHLGFLAGQIGRLITISTTPVIAGDSFEMDAVGALRLSPLLRGLAIDSTVDIFTFYVRDRQVYGEQWFFSSRGRHTIFACDWSSDVCSSDLERPRLRRILRGTGVNASRAVLRFVAWVMIVSGLLLITDAVLTLAWQEPISAYLANRQQVKDRKSVV